MKTFLINLLDWIYKKKCYFCGNSKESVKMCPSCYDEMQHLTEEKNRDASGIEIYCAGEYEANLQKLIRGVKYHRQKDLAYYQAKFMYEYWKNITDKKDLYEIVPVPLYKTRQKQRTYNHMELVAEEFCKLSGYKINTELIKRIKDTKPQYKLNKAQRMENLSNAFKINENAKTNSSIMLMDDICTTGSTFESIVLELQKSGINDIVCFATTGVIN